MSEQSLLEVLLKSTGVSIDSRTIKPGEMFFALPGVRTDGVRFADQALEKGACISVVPERSVDTDNSSGFWPVQDVLVAMQQLAKQYRRHLAVPVLAITGSNGKTTNKNLLAATLGKKFKVHFTAGNFNNHIGLPLTILNAPRETEFLLLEMGTNHFGEIDALCRIAEPDFGSILNIGKTHLEFLHSIAGVLKAKSELADYLIDHGGHLFLNLEEESLDPLETHPVDMILFDRDHLPATDDVIRVDRVTGGIVLWIKSKDNDDLILQSPLWGRHNVKNLIHAIALSSYFGVEMEAIVEALSSYVPHNNRSQILDWRGHRVYLDAYNANPTSMSESIIFFRQEHPHKGTLILGDMGELGKTAVGEHRNILRLADDLGFEQVWLVGDLFRKAAGKRYPNFNFCPEVSFIDERKIIKENPILIKGSRSMELERLLTADR